MTFPPSLEDINNWNVDDASNWWETPATGAVTISPSAYPDYAALYVDGTATDEKMMGINSVHAVLINPSDASDWGFSLQVQGDAHSTPIASFTTLGGVGLRVNADGGVGIDSKVGFFGTVPVAKPTGVAVSAAGIHAALVSLGLISA